jgi:hypothetical protein
MPPLDAALARAELAAIGADAETKAKTLPCPICGAIGDCDNRLYGPQEYAAPGGEGSGWDDPRRGSIALKYNGHTLGQPMHCARLTRGHVKCMGASANERQV